jgi:hypothetical protein
MCSAWRDWWLLLVAPDLLVKQAGSTAQMRAGDRPPGTGATELPTTSYLPGQYASDLGVGHVELPRRSRGALRESARSWSNGRRIQGLSVLCTLAVGLQARPSALEFLEADCVW